MKKYVLQAALVLVSGHSFAQNTLLAGRIVDEQNKPITGAVVIVMCGDNNTIEATTDHEGLYCTKPFTAGTYKVIISTNDHNYKAHKIAVAEPRKAKQFYDFTLAGNKAELHIDSQDPFMQVAFEKVDKKNVYDIPEPKRNTLYKGPDYLINSGGILRLSDSTKK